MLDYGEIVSGTGVAEPVDLQGFNSISGLLKLTV